MKEYRLCYIDRVDDWNTFKLYFTSKYEDQWGDDWNDRPACCNAEAPYEDDDHKIISIYAEFNWMASDIIFGGSTYSVEDMNKSGIPWLIYKNMDYTDYKLMGGDTFIDVLTILEVSGVCSYWLDKDIIDMLYRTIQADGTMNKVSEVFSSLEDN